MACSGCKVTVKVRQIETSLMMDQWLGLLLCSVQNLKYLLLGDLNLRLVFFWNKIHPCVFFPQFDPHLATTIYT